MAWEGQSRKRRAGQRSPSKERGGASGNGAPQILREGMGTDGTGAEPHGTCRKGSDGKGTPGSGAPHTLQEGGRAVGPREQPQLAGEGPQAALPARHLHLQRHRRRRCRRRFRLRGGGSQSAPPVATRGWPGQREGAAGAQPAHSAARQSGAGPGHAERAELPSGRSAGLSSA